MQAHYEDPLAEQERIDLDQAREEMKRLALQDAIAIVQASRGQMMQQVATEENVPLPNLTPSPGGPAPGEEVRRERPEMGAFPGVGAPITPPMQQ